LIKNYFFLKVNDDYRRVSLDVARDFSNESLFVNQSDRNAFTVNPYLFLKPGSPSNPVIGYMYVNTWYEDPIANDTVDHIGYGEVLTPLSSRTKFITGAKYVQSESDIQDIERTDVYTGPKHDYAESSYIFFTGGNSWFNFGEGRHATQPFWSAGITHHYSTLTASFETGLSYIPDPLRVLRREDRYVATIRKNTARSSLSVSGSLTEYRTRTSTRGTLPAQRRNEICLDIEINVALDLSTSRHKSIRHARSGPVSNGGGSNTVPQRSLPRFDRMNAYSPDVFLDNYYDNRVIFEIKGSLMCGALSSRCYIVSRQCQISLKRKLFHRKVAEKQNRKKGETNVVNGAKAPGMNYFQFWSSDFP
jgi:hypothetical protein